MKISFDSLLDQSATSKLLTGDGAPLAAHIHKGASKAMVVAGANASGKSVFVQILASRARTAGALAVSISIRERTGAGSDGMSGMRKMMMFGDESEQSTGATSVSTVKKGFTNLLEHAKEKPTLLILDEPEMGLSDDYAAAMGTWIGHQVQMLDQDNQIGVVVVSHSRPLVQALQTQLDGEQPHFVCMEASQSLDQWIATPIARSVAELLALPDEGNRKRASISRLLR